MMVSWLAIALIFFAVTAVLAVGPLFVWRLFLGAEKSGQPQRRGFPVLATLFGLGAAIGVVVAMFWTVRVSSSRVTNEVVTSSLAADAVTSSAASERSLFESDFVRGEAISVPPRLSATPGRPVFLLALLALVGLLVFAGSRLRENLFRLVPVVLVAVLVGYLYLGTWRAHEQQLEIRRLETVAVRMATDADEQRQRERPFLAERVGPIETVGATALAVYSGEETPGEETTAVDATAEDAQPTDIPMPVTEYVGKELFGVPCEELPDWTKGDAEEGTLRVLHSGKHATVALAERDALTQLQNLLRAEFVQKHADAAGWVPPEKVVTDSGSLVKRAVERSQIEVGDFISPMYEAYWLVDTAVEAPLFQAWRPTVVKTRLGWLGAGVGLLTLLFGSLAAFLRFDEQTGGQRRKALTIGTVAMWAAIGGALLVLA